MADKGLSFVCDISSRFTCLYWFVLVCTGLYWFAVVGGCCSGEPTVLQCIPAVLASVVQWNCNYACASCNCISSLVCCCSFDIYCTCMHHTSHTLHTHHTHTHTNYITHITHTTHTNTQHTCAHIHTQMDWLCATCRMAPQLASPSPAL